MKKLFYLAICALALTFAACEYDNYDEIGRASCRERV